MQGTSTNMGATVTIDMGAARARLLSRGYLGPFGDEIAMVWGAVRGRAPQATENGCPQAPSLSRVLHTLPKRCRHAGLAVKSLPSL